MACTHLSYHACSSWLQHAHGVSLRLARMFPLLFFVASRPLSPRGHVVVVGVVVVVRAFLVVVAGAAGSGELLVAVAGAAAGVGSR